MTLFTWSFYNKVIIGTKGRIVGRWLGVEYRFFLDNRNVLSQLHSSMNVWFLLFVFLKYSSLKPLEWWFRLHLKSRHIPTEYMVPVPSRPCPTSCFLAQFLEVTLIPPTRNSLAGLQEWLFDEETVFQIWRKISKSLPEGLLSLGAQPTLYSSRVQPQVSWSLEKENSDNTTSPQKGGRFHVITVTVCQRAPEAGTPFGPMRERERWMMG